MEGLDGKLDPLADLDLTGTGRPAPTGMAGSTTYANPMAAANARGLQMDANALAAAGANIYNSSATTGSNSTGQAAYDAIVAASAAIDTPNELANEQLKAAIRYVNAVSDYIQSPESKNKAKLDTAKQGLVDLNVSRSQIESVNHWRFPDGIDTSGGISGVMGPSVSGVLGDIGQGAIDIIGTGGQAFSDLITLGAGPEVAQTLLDPVSIFTGGFGGTINYSDSGKTTPVILGNTSATGMPVGLNIPDPRAIAEEGLIPWLINNAGLGGPAAAAAIGATANNALDSTLTGDGVGLSPASLIAAAAALDEDSDTAADVIKTGAENIATGGADSDSPVIRTGGADSDSPVIRTDSDSPVIRTGGTAIETGGGGGGGGGVSNSTQGGIAEIAGEPGDLVDIRYLFDVGGADIFAPPLTEEEEDELLYPYREGGAVKRFHTGGGVAHNHNTTGGQDDSYNLAPGADDGGGGGFDLVSFLGDNAAGIIGAGIGGLFGLSGGSDGRNPSGYQGGIPEYTYDRALKDNAFVPTMLDAAGETVARRPGSAGRSYFNYPETSAYSPIMESRLDPATGEMLLDDEGNEQQFQRTMGGAARRVATTQDALELAEQQALEQEIGTSFLDANPTLPYSSPPQRRSGSRSSTEWTYEDQQEEAQRYATELAERATAAADINLSAIAETLRGGSQTPAQAARAAGINEEDLIVRLIRAGETNFYDVAEYYKDHPVYGGVTAAQVQANFTNSNYAQGGNVNGYYLGGPTDGMADQIPATIDGGQPAALSDGEFVIPADIVSHLGNGNSDAGAESLYSMMERVRTDRTGNPNQGRQIDPNKYLA